MQFLLYVVDNIWCCRCREGKDGGARLHGSDVGNIKIRRAEVVTPLTDAMSLVDCDETDVDMA